MLLRLALQLLQLIRREGDTNRVPRPRTYRAHLFLLLLGRWLQILPVTGILGSAGARCGEGGSVLTARRRELAKL